MRILGIETSCDETGVALYDQDQGLLGHVLHSQAALHSRYGGVVPELASRDHIRKTLPMVRQLLDECGLTLQDIDGVAYTAGPGLVGALLVGASIGRALAWGLGVRAIPVHHLEAHLLAPMLEAGGPRFPFVALLVSGGHTLLAQVEGVGQYTVLGETLDDAAGEAFDKIAKLLDLPYPGGPHLARLAADGDVDRFQFPRPMTDRPGLDFSFSGLKTFAINTYREHEGQSGVREAVAAAFQEAVVDTLFIKCRRALQATGLQRLVVAGGVGANARLRERLQALEQGGGGGPAPRVYYPRPEFCTDNGAMIAFAGWVRAMTGEQAPPAFDVRARWPLTDLPIPGR